MRKSIRKFTFSSLLSSSSLRQSFKFLNFLTKLFWNFFNIRGRCGMFWTLEWEMMMNRIWKCVRINFILGVFCVVVRERMRMRRVKTIQMEICCEKFFFIYDLYWGWVAVSALMMLEICERIILASNVHHRIISNSIIFLDFSFFFCWIFNL